MPDQSNVEKICEILGVFPEELNENLPADITAEKVSKLEALIESEVQKATLDAGIRELAGILSWNMDNGLIKTNASGEPFTINYRYVELSEMRATLTQEKNK